MEERVGTQQKHKPTTARVTDAVLHGALAMPAVLQPAINRSLLTQSTTGICPTMNHAARTGTQQYSGELRSLQMQHPPLIYIKMSTSHHMLHLHLAETGDQHYNLRERSHTTHSKTSTTKNHLSK